MRQSVPSPHRRWLLAGVLLAAGALLISVAERRDREPVRAAGGDFNACARLKGEAARDCYGREVGRELAAVGGGGGPKITLAVPANAGEVTFTSVTEAQPLLCDLHARVGVVDAQVPSWLGWTEPLAQAAP